MSRYTPALLLAALLINPGVVAAEEIHRVRLNLDTPFTHRNVLRTRLQAGNRHPSDCASNNNGIDFVSSDRQNFPVNQVFDNNSNKIVVERLLNSILEENCRAILVDSESLVPENN